VRVRGCGIALVLAAAFAASTDAGQAPTRPPRDVGPRAPRSAVSGAIAGRVVDAQTSAPLRRVEVAAFGPAVVEAIVALTDDDGRFEIPGLEPGPWSLTASKIGYVTQQHGQRRPFDHPAPITIDATGGTARGDFALMRASAITGRVYDEYGDPLAAIRVNVMRARMIRQRRHLERVGDGDLTDDTGAFRIHGLAPGDYYVTASLRVAAADSVVQTTYAPTYYPGTGNFAEAQRVFLEAGKDVVVDFPLSPFRTARVSGVVVTSSGMPGDALLDLASEAGELGVPIGVGGVTRADGTFTLPEVPPGTYTLNVSLRGDTVGSEVAAIPLTVYGDDVSGLTVVTMRPGTMRGSVVADTGVTRPLPSGLSIVARSARMSNEATFADIERGAFRLTVPPGPIRLFVDPPDGWMVKTMSANNVDVTDGVVDIAGQQDVPVRVVLTDRISELTGTVAGAAGGPTASVIVFPDDSARWAPPSRYVRTATTDARGAFRVVGLPEAARYLAVAVDGLEEGEGDDPDFLARIRERAVGFSLAEGGKRAIELPLLRR
jgi:hypothetical protein